MTPSTDSYLNRINHALDEIQAGASGRLSEIDHFESSVARRILRVLIQHACVATHAGAIVPARNKIASMPQGWLAVNLDPCIRASVNVDDEWDYRRVLELLQQVKPDLMTSYIIEGLTSTNRDVQLAARDFQTGRYGRITGVESDE